MNFCYRFYAGHLFTMLCLLLLSVGGCTALQDLADNIQKPKLSVTDMRVTGFNFDEIELTYDVTVDNPNSLSLQLSSYNYDFKLNEETFIEGRQDEYMEIEASGQSTLEVPVTLNFKQVYEGFRDLSDSDEAAYEFLSELTFDLPVIGDTKIPVSKKGSIPMIKRPSIRVSNLEIRNLSFSSADLALHMEFENPNAFGIRINEFDYGLTINADQWAQGKSLANTLISEKGSSRLTIPLSLNISEIGLSAYRLLSGTEDLNYSLKGTFNLGTTHPLLDQTDWNVNRSGSLSLTGN